MIHTTRQTAKFRKLVRWLRPQLVEQGVLISVETIAVGLLEGLWHLTISSAQRGDLGADLENIDIADGIGWYGDEDAIVDALVDSGWLDRCPKYRLVVHNWEKSGPQFIKRNIARKGGYVVAQAPLNDSSERLSGACATETTQVSGQARTPNLTKPNQTKPDLVALRSSGDDGGTLVDDSESESIEDPDAVPPATDLLGDPIVPDDVPPLQPPAIKPDDVVTAWNASGATTAVRKLSDARRAKLRTRLKDPSWPWEAAIAKLPIPNTKTFDWQPSFDWLIENDTNADKLVEGNYDRGSPVSGGTTFKPNNKKFGEGF